MGSFGCIAIAASVAGTKLLHLDSHFLITASELVSAYPTSGGIYTSTAFVVSKRYRASVTFVTAWSVATSFHRTRLTQTHAFFLG